MADEQHLQDMFQTAGRDEAAPPAFDDIDLPEQPVAIKCNACLLDSFAEKDMSRDGLVCLLCDVLEPEVCKDVRERYRAANPVGGAALPDAAVAPGAAAPGAAALPDAVIPSGAAGTPNANAIRNAANDPPSDADNLLI